MTDDFNLFHDDKECQRIRHNPFNDSIVLGFQFEALIEREIEVSRSTQSEREIIEQGNL